MFKRDVKDAGDALAHLTDCTLATVSRLAMKKSAPKGELARQIGMAQQAINWMKSFGISYASTRAAEVDKMGGSVEEWAKQYKPKS